METNTLNKNLISKERPKIIENLNNGRGTFYYNHNIRKIKVIESDGCFVMTNDNTSANETMYQYDCVRVEYPKTADNIFSTLLTAKYPVNTERKMANEYQSAVLGLLPEDKKKPYEDFLKDRLSIRVMVDADCKKYNIPNNL